MATVKHVAHPDGSHSIGVEIDGAYIALASASAPRVTGEIERQASLKERADAGDEDAAAVLAQATGGKAKEAKE